jgi:hypothetical protein
MYHYPRTELALQLVQALQGRIVLSDARNGLFLASPRRTGKSTFLQQDLKPQLEKSGVVVVYVDLWADQAKDPALLIGEKIVEALQPFLGAVTKMAQKAGLESVSIGGALKLNTSGVGQIDSETLPGMLQALSKAANKPVALIIDEAQHALTSANGSRVMAALKSARDQMNSPNETNLMLVMSGSDRDKLLRLVNTSNAPFYGSHIQSLPLLDRGFTDQLARLIETQSPGLGPVDRSLLYQAFELFAHRPQFFINAIEKAASPLVSSHLSLAERVLEEAKSRQNDDEAQMDADFIALKPLERAVLWRILEQGAQFKPYDASALNFYLEKTGKKVTSTLVQTALENLRAQSPPLVWKSERGEYAVENGAMHTWYWRRNRENAWPPRSPHRPTMRS